MTQIEKVYPKQIVVGEFEKVSFKQFYEAMSESLSSEYAESSKFMNFVREAYDNLQLPSRATSGSAGYDFRAPYDFQLRPGFSLKIPTGIRVKIGDGWWLGCLPRSGLGFKYGLRLANTMGVIDSDYYNSDNEGHIFAKITNNDKSGRILEIKAGDGFMQAIFLPYGITYSDTASNIRNGGMGSTD